MTYEEVVLDMRAYDVSQLESLPDIVKQVVAAGTDVILASSPLVIEAALRATRTVPIVGVDIESDPIVKGWVATMARPGGNFTGFFLDAPDLHVVLKLAQEGKTLPQKSTYFHPKPPSGMVFHRLRDARL